MMVKKLLVNLSIRHEITTKHILPSYVVFRRKFACGIPSGEKADWEKLVSRLDKLPTFGPEPAAAIRAALWQEE